jgi:SAM-dependent methyltransferase
MAADSPDITTEGPLGRLHRAWLTIAEERRRSGLLGVAQATNGIVRASWPALREVAEEVLLDVRLRIRTRGIVHNEATLQRVSSVDDSHPYEPVHLDWWRQLVAASPLTPTHTTFVDLGAGRGRALILAAEAGFRRVIGVEIDPHLVASAEANLDRWVRRRRRAGGRPEDLRVALGDAADYPLPGGDVLLCLYNPFGPETLSRVLTRVCARPSPWQNRTAIAYFNPIHDDVFRHFPDLRVCAQGDHWKLYSLDAVERRISSQK